MKLYEGCVENRNDPLKLGRCQVRIVGLHTHDKNILPTNDLPWAYPLQPVTSAGISGIGHSPLGAVEGSWVLVTFRDEDEQMPIMLGTVGGIPQEDSIVFDKDSDGGILKNTETGDLEVITTNPEETASVVKPATEVVETTKNTVSCAHLNTIPAKCPPDIKKNVSIINSNISTILNACCKAGFTKEQTASMLGIVGGECGFIPKSEDYEYKDPSYLMKTFKSAFGNDLALAEQYSKWKSLNKGTIEEFFEFIYGYTNKKGRELGNTAPGDGGKYYGRGLIQLTGKANYTKYAQLSGHNIVNNPDLLNTDMTISADIAVLYFNDRIKTSSKSAHPGYFNAAKAAINPYDNPTKKVQYYEYFYGQSDPAVVEEKTVEVTPPTETAPIKSGAVTTPSPSSNPVLGFKDPNNKYPLKSLLHEQDTNRLARGISAGTNVPVKESNRAKNIPKALSSETFSEPSPAFGARYPFNHVFESESGHVQEWDDTPGFERIHTYHRKGTFTEIDSTGTEVHHIVGDSYEIVDRNGCIYIKGECNITVDGDTNIFARSDANIEVAGDASMQVGGDFNLGVAENMNVAVGKNLNFDVGNQINMQASSINETSQNMNVNSAFYKETVGESHYRYEGDKYTFIGADTYNRHDSGIDYACPIDPPRSSEEDCSSVSSAESVDPGLTSPALGSPLYPVFDYLVAPNQDDEELNKFETPEEWATPAGVALLEKLKEKYPTDDTTSKEESAPKGGSDKVVPANCDVIFSTDDFTSDFRLSTNFTLGMFFDGGFNKKHILKGQNGLSKQQIVCNLSQVAQNILEPALSILPGGIGGYGSQWRISSGYRMGSSGSQHNKGLACDIALSHNTKDRKQTTYQLAKSLEFALPYDQIILEYRGPSENWVHLSYNPSGNRKQAFTMLNDKTYPQAGAKGFHLL